MDNIILGIDLGTTNTVASYYKNNTFHLIPLIQKSPILPSTIQCLQHKHPIIGKSINEENVIYNVKRIIGKSSNNVELTKNMKIKEDGTLIYNILDKEYTPEKMSSFVLSYVKSCAEKHLQKQIQQCVITVPAYFDNKQRLMTKKAAKLANLDVIRIINEPTAAAIAYNLQTQKNQNIIVYDLGGGTLDVSLLEIDDNVIEVIATSGNNHLGGCDIDRILYNYINTKSKNNSKMIDPIILNIAKQMKHTISLNRSAKCKVNNRLIRITPFMFEHFCKSFFQKAIAPITKVLNDSKYKPEDIHSIVLIGGSTRLPQISKMLKKMFPTTQIYNNIDPDTTVAIGAGIQGYTLSQKQNKMVPYSKHKNTLQELLLIDVTPFSIGVQGPNKTMIRVINRNSTIPLKVTKIFTTTRDDQTTITVTLFQGEYYFTHKCNKLGTFHLTDLPKQKAGLLQIEIIFSINCHGILHVEAIEKITKKKQSITLEIS